MLMPLTVAEAVLPALSLAVPVTDCAAPSLLRVVGPAQLATAESASAQVKLTVTSLLFQPAAFAAGEAAPVIVGGVLSMLMPLTVAEAVFPAVSVQLPLADCAAPSVPRVIGAVSVATPEVASVQLNVTVTDWLVQVPLV